MRRDITACGDRLRRACFLRSQARRESSSVRTRAALLMARHMTTREPPDAHITLSANTLTLVRGGSPDDVARLLACGGRILAQGTHISVQEWPAMGTLDAPYALVAVGKRQVLIVLLAG